MVITRINGYMRMEYTEVIRRMESGWGGILIILVTERPFKTRDQNVTSCAWSIFTPVHEVFILLS